MKQCNTCGKSKPLTEYHKRKASADGRQMKCKSCVKQMNEEFREINPKYQVQWQRSNSKTWHQYMNEYKRANKSSIIYKITAPDGLIYIGQTKSKFGVRISYHKQHYKRMYMTIPLLHKSFDRHGYTNHKFETLIDLGDLDRAALRRIETSIIQEYMQKGISLNAKSK